MKEVLIKEYTDLKQLNLPYKKKENVFSHSKKSIGLLDLRQGLELLLSAGGRRG